MLRHFAAYFILQLCTSFAFAQEFFTWVDANGQVHNSSVSKSQQAQQAQQSATQKPYLSEEEFKRQQAQEKLDNPPFFTWIDTAGQVHNEFIPAPKAQSASQATHTEQYVDDSYVPTLRLAHFKRAQQCCQQYAGVFNQRSKLLAKRSYHLVNIQDNPPFKLHTNTAPAFYLRIPKGNGLRKIEVMQLHATLKPSVIALDSNFVPLHQSHALKGIKRDENWAQNAQRYFALELADKEIAYIIWYYADALAAHKIEQVQLVVRWYTQDN